MAKGSVRKKGKKWYYRFYVEDASGNLVQKEFAGTESKSETEKMLRKAMEDYDAKKFLAKADNLTLGQMLDVWAEEDLKTGSLSNGTVGNYLQAVNRIKQHPIGNRKLKTVTSEHLQKFMDLLAFGGEEDLKTGSLSNGTVGNYLQAVNRIKQHPIGNRKLKTVTSEHLQKFMDLLAFGGEEGNFKSKGYTIDYIRSFHAVLQQSFRFAVFPKQYITFNPMQYVVMRRKAEEDVDLFSDNDEDAEVINPITPEQYQTLMEYLEERNKPAVLPVQIAYYTGLRLGEVCGLSWSDINFEEQYLTVRRSVRYNGARHKTEIGPTKRKKVRIVDFCDTLADILKKAKKEQRKQVFSYGELYQRNYYREVKEKNRIYYELYHLDGTEDIPLDYNEIDLVCIRPDGAYEAPATVETALRTARKRLSELDDNFHFHTLRHTYTTNLLSNGAAPKDVQELLGHSDVSTTMNVYAHANREGKRNSARLLDKVVGE